MVPSDFAAIPGLLALAQSPESQPAVPGASGSGPAFQGATPPTGPTGAPTSTPNSMGPLLWMLPVILLVMLVLPSLGQKKQKKQRDSMMASLKRGDQVLTTAGILGSIVEVNDNDVLLRVDEGSNTRVRFTKAAIQQVIREGRDGARTDVELKPEGVHAR